MHFIILLLIDCIPLSLKFVISVASRKKTFAEIAAMELLLSCDDMPHKMIVTTKPLYGPHQRSDEIHYNRFDISKYRCIRN